MKNMLWIEKYRPKSLDDLIGQRNIVGIIKAYLEVNDIPNMIFVGKAGVGKTTIAKIIAKALYGENMMDNYIELNGSDERGIDTIRDLISGFMSSGSSSDIPFKLIFFDEADYLTNEAQTSLRRPIEDFSSSVRFIFSVNYPEKIIEPIKSRCIILYFNPISKSDIIERLNYILSVEDEDNIVFDEVIEKIADISNGDLRKAINLLQNIYIRIKNNISYDDLFKNGGSNLNEIIEKMHSRVVSNDIQTLREIIIETIGLGYSPSEILDGMYNYFIKSEKIDIYDTAHLIERIAKAQSNLTNHLVNAEVQIMYVWTYLITKERNSIIKNVPSNPKDYIKQKINKGKR